LAWRIGGDAGWQLDLLHEILRHHDIDACFLGDHLHPGRNVDGVAEKVDLLVGAADLHHDDLCRVRDL
jgi:hypothetical protein